MELSHDGGKDIGDGDQCRVGLERDDGGEDSCAGHNQAKDCLQEADAVLEGRDLADLGDSSLDQALAINGSVDEFLQSGGEQRQGQ